MSRTSRAAYFTDKIAIVTGGGSGIGRALCLELARRGAVVHVTDVSGSSAEAVASSIRSSGKRATSAALDVTDAKAVAASLDALIAEHGRIDLVFNNAGIAIGGEERYVSDDDWRRVLDIDLHAVVNGSRAAYARMVKQGSGHIVNTASVAGLVPVGGEISYTTAKFAVVGLSQGLRAEGASLGVKVSVLCPGFINTPILDSPVRGNEGDAERLRRLLPTPMAPETCARLALDAVARNEAIIVVTAHAKALHALARISPSATSWVATKIIDQMRSYLGKRP